MHMGRRGGLDPELSGPAPNNFRHPDEGPGAGMRSPGTQNDSRSDGEMVLWQAQFIILRVSKQRTDAIWPTTRRNAITGTATGSMSEDYELRYYQGAGSDP